MLSSYDWEDIFKGSSQSSFGMMALELVKYHDKKSALIMFSLSVILAIAAHAIRKGREE